jgi:hypothetical protein
VKSTWYFALTYACTGILAALLSACAPARFNTELSSTDNLSPGNPVTTLGTTIGSVASVSPLPDGNSAVAFDVDHSDARLVLEDSIIVLRHDNGPGLEVLNTNPISLRAPAGATLEGAANEQQTNLLVASRMPGFNTGLGAISAALGAAAAMPPGAATAPAATTLQQQLNALQNWYVANGARNTAAAVQQLQQINQSAAALERQLLNQGRSAQAQQLKDEIDQLTKTLAGYTLPPSPPNTLVTPPVH